VGSTLALDEEDVIGPMFRNMGSILARDYPMEKILAGFLGRATGPTGGRDGNTHFGDLDHGLIGPISMLGALIPVCAGAGLAFKMRGEPRVALTYIGDGGSSVGDFHEGLNLAAVNDLPLIVIVENNGWAYSTPVSAQTRTKDFAGKAAAYGIPGVKIDGTDVVLVYETVREAAERARKGRGPTLIEAVAMRMKGHAEHDDAAYVPKEALKEWENKDPIRLHEKRLIDWGILTPDAARAIHEKAKEQVALAERKALEAPWPEPSAAGQGVYAEEVPEEMV
jgi:pyruvate dehydrogenase E1 component alpha subunit